MPSTLAAKAKAKAKVAAKAAATKAKADEKAADDAAKAAAAEEKAAEEKAADEKAKADAKAAADAAAAATAANMAQVIAQAIAQNAGNAHVKVHLPDPSVVGIKRFVREYSEEVARTVNVSAFARAQAFKKAITTYVKQSAFELAFSVTDMKSDSFLDALLVWVRERNPETTEDERARIIEAWSVFARQASAPKQQFVDDFMQHIAQQKIVGIEYPTSILPDIFLAKALLPTTTKQELLRRIDQQIRCGGEQVQRDLQLFVREFRLIPDSDLLAVTNVRVASTVPGTEPSTVTGAAQSAARTNSAERNRAPEGRQVRFAEQSEGRGRGRGRGRGAFPGRGRGRGRGGNRDRSQSRGRETSDRSQSRYPSRSRSPRGDMPPCFDFQAGRCNRDNCRFSHSGGGGPTGPNDRWSPRRDPSPRGWVGGRSPSRGSSRGGDFRPPSRSRGRSDGGDFRSTSQPRSPRFGASPGRDRFRSPSNGQGGGRPACHQHAQGHCSFGNNCRFEHANTPRR